MKVRDLLASSAFMMGLALIVSLGLGLTGNFPQIAPYDRSSLTIIILAAMMTVSLSRIPFSGLSPSKDPRGVLRALILGILVASLIPLAAWALLGDSVYKDGLIFVAATPFAASVVPLSYIMRGDMEHAARSTIIVYLASILYIPVLVWLTLGESVNMADVVISVAEVMVLPLFLSRLITRVKIDKYVMAVVLNCAIFMLVVLSVGATANFFRSEATLLLIFMGIAVLRTFVLGVGLEFTERRLGIKWSQRVTDVLMTSYKKKGVAIALCMAVLPAAALFPITASIVVEICWVIFMDAVLFSKRRMSRELRREGSEPVDPAVSP